MALKKNVFTQGNVDLEKLTSACWTDGDGE